MIKRGADHATQGEDEKVEFIGRDMDIPMDEESVLDCNYQKGLRLPYTEFIAAVRSCCYPVGMMVRYRGHKYIVGEKKIGFIRRDR